MRKQPKNTSQRGQGKLFLTILIISMAILMWMANVSAVGLGCFKINENIFIVTNSNSSAINITEIISPSPGSQIIIRNVEMTKVGSSFNYSLTPTKLGIYSYGYCEIEGNCFNNQFEITPSGKCSSSTGESLLYFVFVIIMFGLLLMMLYFIFSMPKGNENEGRSVKIVKIKYFRVLLIAITYPIIMILINLMNGLAENFTSLSIFSGTLGFLFQILLRGVWVWTILMFGWIIVMLIKDSNIKRNMARLGRIRV